jgi:putative membrane protein
MNNDYYHYDNGSFFEPILMLLFVISLLTYIVAAVITSSRYKRWPFYRTFFWGVGVLCMVSSLVGPIAHRAHYDFTAHMLGHLLLGMLAPLLIVLSAPMILVLRTLNVKTARRFSSVLKSWPLQMVSDPIVASLFNMGGLWILYTTDIYLMMHQNYFLYFFIHIHVFLAGYLFTLSIIHIGPAPNKSSFLYRAIVSVIALASHGILSKYLYAHPPAGVPVVQAEKGSMLMYYGGDAIEMILIIIFCLQWYKAKRPRIVIDRSIGS